MRAWAMSSLEVSNAVAAVPRAIVAIPVCNEREHIGRCLEALAGQVALEPGNFGIVLFLNNCIDGTETIVRDFSGLPWPMRVVEQTSPSATAGWARRNAMEVAACWLEEGGEDGVLLTSDADSQVGRDWVSRNLAEIANGADAVAGRIALEPTDAALLPTRLHERGRLEAEYEALLTEIGARLDPEPGNPWPCHWSKSGATLAVRLSVFRTIGGMPDMPSGEDRAFVDAVRAHDLVVRHAPDIEVVTSGRLEGRATGGVADTMKLRCDRPDSPCDDRLERLDRLVLRALWRRRLRRLHRQGRLAATWRWAPLLSIPQGVAAEITREQHFGRAHAAIEAASRKLAYQPLRPAQLPGQIRLARLLVPMLRRFDWPSRILDRVETRPFTTDTGPASRLPSAP